MGETAVKSMEDVLLLSLVSELCLETMAGGTTFF